LPNHQSNAHLYEYIRGGRTRVLAEVVGAGVTLIPEDVMVSRVPCCGNTKLKLCVLFIANSWLMIVAGLTPSTDEGLM